MKSLSLRYGLILFLLIIDSLDSAAVPKGGAGSGGRGVKGNSKRLPYLEELHSNFKRLNQWNFKKKFLLKECATKRAGERQENVVPY